MRHRVGEHRFHASHGPVETETGQSLSYSSNDAARPVHRLVFRGFQSLCYQSVPIDRRIKRASQRLVPQFRVPDVQEHEKRVRPLEREDLRLRRRLNESTASTPTSYSMSTRPRSMSAQADRTES